MSCLKIQEFPVENLNESEKTASKIKRETSNFFIINPEWSKGVEQANVPVAEANPANCGRN